MKMKKLININKINIYDINANICHIIHGYQKCKINRR